MTKAIDPNAWISNYAEAWRTKDDNAVAELFTENGRYRVTPFEQPHRGKEEIRAYWRNATSTQEEFQIEMGEPVIQDNRAVVEWWATMFDRDSTDDPDEAASELTLPGCLILRFNEDGLCEELREYWHLDIGRRLRPPEGWGK